MKDISLLINNGVDVKGSLELFGEMDMYDATLNDFLEGINAKLTRLNNYKNLSDMPNYAIEVHSLKSDAKYLGFKKLAELAYDHELKSKANDKYYVNNNYEELITEANRVIELSKKYMSGVSSINNNSENIFREIKERSILVVDDSDIIRNFVERIFHRDFNVIVANNGQEAINIIESDNNQNIVTMLLDLNMPKVDGFEVLEYFKEHDLFNKIPVSIITGDDSRDRIDKAFKYPIVDMIVKPFNENNIKSVIIKTINSK